MIENNLPNILRDKKWNQRILSEKSGLNPNTIAIIYNQVSTPSAETMEKICNALDMSLGEVFFIGKKKVSEFDDSPIDLLVG